MYEYRCDERLKVTGEGSTHLGYTGLGLVTFTKYVVFCLKDILYQLQNIFRQVNGVGNVFGTSPRVRRSANLTHPDRERQRSSRWCLRVWIVDSCGGT